MSRFPSRRSVCATLASRAPELGCRRGQLRPSRQLRQPDLGKLPGGSLGWVSYVEYGETTLDIIELRHWLGAVDYKFLRFVRKFDAGLREVERLRRGWPSGNRQTRRATAIMR